MARLLALLTLLGLGAAWLGAGHQVEQGSLAAYHEPMARWLQGRGPLETPAHPLWGYPLLLAFLPPPLLLGLQAVLGALAAALAVRAGETSQPRGARPLRALVFLGFPWFLLLSLRSPQAPAAALAVLSFVLLADALERSSLAAAAAAGLPLGLALNFRPDHLAWPLLVLAALTVSRPRPRALPCALAYAAAAWLCVVPWLLHVHAWTGSWSPLPTNGGRVAWLSLGQLQPNPWAVEHDDAWLATTLPPGTVPCSAAEDALLRRRFSDAVASHPLAFARKAAHNLLAAFLGGFYAGEPLAGDPARREALDVLRERAKLALGVNPNEAQVADYRARGLWDRPPRDPLVLLAFAWLVAAALLGDLVLVLAVVGLVLGRREAAASPWLAVAALAFGWQLLLVALVQYEPRHMNAVYPCAAPLAALALARLRAQRA